MNKKLLTLLATALLYSCGDGVLDNEHSQNAKPKLLVTLTDYSNGSPIANASLSVQSTGKTAKTAENGKVLFEDISIGSHTLRIEADGFATAIVTPYVDEVKRAGETGRATYASYALYPKTATLEGYVQHTGSDGQVKALTGLPVRVAFDCDNLAEKITEPVLTAEGKFSIPNLPAIDGACQYSIQTIGATIGGQTFGAMTFSTSNPALKKGSKTIIANPIDVSKGAGLFTVVSYTREIEYGKENTPIVFTFSENIAANQQRKITAPDTSVAGYNVEIADNKITLTPFSNWNIGSSFTVTFANLKSESGKTYSSTHDVETLSMDISNSPIEGLRLLPGSQDIKYSDKTASITFKKVEGATSYKYFLKEKDKVSLIPCTPTLPTSGNTAVTAVCPIAIDVLNPEKMQRLGDNTNKLIVQAYNARYESLKSDTLEIKETKTVAPKIATNTVYRPLIENGKILDMYGMSSQEPNIDIGSEILKALVLATETSMEYIYFYFDRAMNTSTKLNFVCTGAATVCDRLDMTYNWFNEQVLGINIKVKAGTATIVGTAVNVDLTIKNLTGVNGKPFDNGEVPSSSDLTGNITGTTPSSICEVNPFASEACVDSDKETFCNNLKNYSGSQSGCKVKYPNPCNGTLPALAGTSICPSYAAPTSPTPPPTLSGYIVDVRDGQMYKIVTIGTQTWMAENLNYDTETNGSVCYNGDCTTYGRYGRLYNWITAMDIASSYQTSQYNPSSSTKYRGVCPSGWHLPNNDEWNMLITTVGTNPGTKLKATSGWNNNSNGTDNFGFSALPGGYINSDSFNNVGYYGHWWTASENNASYANFREMGYYGDVGTYVTEKRNLSSVRCVKD